MRKLSNIFYDANITLILKSCNNNQTKNCISSITYSLKFWQKCVTKNAPPYNHIFDSFKVGLLLKNM